LTDAAVHGRGGAVCIQALAGMGRTRLLEEVAVRARLAGAAVIRADASMYPQSGGTVRALVLRLFDALPELALETSAASFRALADLGPEVQARLGASVTPYGRPSLAGTRPSLAQLAQASLADWIRAISEKRALLIEVDNVEYADDPSLGVIASLATTIKDIKDHAILLVTSERLGRQSPVAIGLSTLRNHSSSIELAGITELEMLELVRSSFGDAPNAQRFGEWLHERTAGSPLHAIEICRQLVSKQIIRYAGGLWTLPIERPDAELPSALGDALSIRIAAVSAPGGAGAPGVGVGRGHPTHQR
jgi:hypothetical protein